MKAKRGGINKRRLGDGKRWRRENMLLSIEKKNNGGMPVAKKTSAINSWLCI
jgi:hypothetical protein